MIFSAIQAFGLELSQQDQSWSLQAKQLPHAIVKGTTTRSPTLSFSLLMPGPTSTTSPINSWPSMSPCSKVGTRPSYRCRSEPQMHVEVILTTASRGLSIVGSGTSWTCIFSLPIQQTAFIESSFRG